MIINVKYALAIVIAQEVIKYDLIKGIEEHIIILVKLNYVLIH